MCQSKQLILFVKFYVYASVIEFIMDCSQREVYTVGNLCPPVLSAQIGTAQHCQIQKTL